MARTALVLQPAYQSRCRIGVEGALEACLGLETRRFVPDNQHENVRLCTCIFKNEASHRVDPVFRFIATRRYLHRHIFERFARQKTFQRVLPFIEKMVVAISKREISAVGSGILSKLRDRLKTVHLKCRFVGPGDCSVAFEQDQPVAEARYEGFATRAG